MNYERGMQAIGGAMAAMRQHAALGPAETPQRMPEVTCELERLQKQVESLGIVAETLTSRLSPVRNQSPNATGEGTCAPDPVLCGIADTLRRERRRLEAIQGELQQALSELEI